MGRLKTLGHTKEASHEDTDEALESSLVPGRDLGPVAWIIRTWV